MHSKYGGRVAHARQVAALASCLFEKLAPLHGLSEKERTPLLCAAHLHDIGHFVHKKKHHKHSYYLILHDHLLDGWDEWHRERTAWIALNHRKKKLRLPEDLKKSRREKMRACIAMLRLADALDCEHDQQTQILGVTIDRANRRVLIPLQGYPLHKHRNLLQAKASLALELWGISLCLENGSEKLLLAP
jgi:exopolyphosphatase/pppGpp-phosphohydrolase